jgi:hypothetical protein
MTYSAADGCHSSGLGSARGGRRRASPCHGRAGRTPHTGVWRAVLGRKWMPTGANVIVATAYVCTYETEQVGTEVRSKIQYGPFPSTPPAEYRYPRLTPGGGSLGVLVTRETQVPEKENHVYPGSPPESLLAPICKPISAGGLGR